MFLCGRGSAATDPDLNNQLVSAVFEMPFPLSTAQNFIYEVKLQGCGKLSSLPCSQAYTDILIGCILCLRWSSWTAEQPNVTRSGDQTHSRTSAGALTPPSKLLQLQGSIDFYSFTAQSKRKKKGNKGVNCPVAEGQTDLLFHPGFLSGRLTRDGSHWLPGAATGTASPVGWRSCTDSRMLMNVTEMMQNRAKVRSTHIYIYIKRIRHIFWNVAFPSIQQFNHMNTVTH